MESWKICQRAAEKIWNEWGRNVCKGINSFWRQTMLLWEVLSENYALVVRNADSRSLDSRTVLFGVSFLSGTDSIRVLNQQSWWFLRVCHDSLTNTRLVTRPKEFSNNASERHNNACSVTKVECCLQQPPLHLYCVQALQLIPERWRSNLDLTEAMRNHGGRSYCCWRANHSCKLRLGAKDSSSHQ